MKPDTAPIPSPLIGTFCLYFLTAWVISAVCSLSTTATAGFFFGHIINDNFSIKAAAIGLILAVLRYAAGAFTLGTLTRQFLGTWKASIIYSIPFFMFHFLSFIGAAMNNSIKETLAANPGLYIFMPIVYILTAPFISFYFIRLGESTAEDFSRPKAILNIQWQHWLWILPFSLFQVVGVPLFFLLTLWKIDMLTSHTSFSTLSVPMFIPRMLLLVILAGVLMSINAAYKALADNSGPVGARTLKVLATWVFLTATQAFIFRFVVGKLAA